MNGIHFGVEFLVARNRCVLDQRENYLAAAGYARGRVLDAFTFAGGFALHLASVPMKCWPSIFPQRRVRWLRTTSRGMG